MAIKGYFDPQTIVHGARDAGLSVLEYVEQNHSSSTCANSAEGGVGYTKSVINWLLENIELSNNAKCLEIGPGTGRYFDTLQQQRTKITCEAYEANPGWAGWLDHVYKSRGLIRRDADGSSLKDTATDSMDLCSAYGVFIYLDTMVVFSYLDEMSRCTRPGGYLYFDILNTDREDIVDVINRCMPNHNYLIAVSRRVVLSFLQQRNIELVAENPMSTGMNISTYMLLRKNRN